MNKTSKNRGKEVNIKKKKEIMRARRIGKFFAFFVPILINMYIYYGLFYIIPNLPFLYIFRKIMNIITIILIFLMYWSYLKAKYCHPGPVPKDWQNWNGSPMTRPKDPIYAIDVSLYGASSISFISKKNSKLYCNKCQTYRPYRTGHCSRCNICVTRIDHHCNFINNCVGSNNQRYFCQFIIYTQLLLILYIMFLPFAKQNIINNIFNGQLFNFNIFLIFILLPFIGSIFFLFMMGLIIGQIQTISRNETFTEIKFGDNQSKSKQSMCWNKKNRNDKQEKEEEEIVGLLTNEDNTNNNTMKNKYDLGSKWKNMETVFGSSIIHWILPLNYNND